MHNQQLQEVHQQYDIDIWYWSYSPFNFRIFCVHVKHIGCYLSMLQFQARPLSCCWSFYCSCWLRKRSSQFLCGTPAAEPHLLSTERFQQWTSAKRLTHFTMISHERPHIATASLCRPPTCIFTSGKWGCHVVCIKHWDTFGPAKENGNWQHLRFDTRWEWALIAIFLKATRKGGGGR